MQASKRKRRAYSLIELVVTIFVVGLLLSSVATALIYCNQYMRTCETKTEAQVEALNAAVWMSRYLQDSNITAMVAQTAPNTSNNGISFQSVRDPLSDQVQWSASSSTTSGGTIEWPQNIVVYQELDPTDPSGQSYRITAKSFINGPPYPLDPPPVFTVAYGLANGGTSTRVLARNIRALAVEIYSSASPAISVLAGGGNGVDTPPINVTYGNSTNTVNISIGSFAPYYALNYGVQVSTSIRPQN